MIPLAEPNLTGKESEYVSQAIASGWVSGGGPFVERFEEMVAKACGRKWAVATLTGTAAIHVALAAVGVKAGMTVTMPSFLFIAAANAVRYLGALPYFIDVERDQYAHWAMLRTDGGSVCDAAPAIGDTDATTRGDLACLSFNGNKTITTGQGGAVVGDNIHLGARVIHLVKTAKIGPYEHDEVGFNYRMANLNAAVGCAQMECLEEFQAAKARIANRYKVEIGHQKPTAAKCWMAFWNVRDRERALAHLRGLGIDARPFWKPLHLQKPFATIIMAPVPRTMDIWEKLVCLPCSTNLTEEDQDKVIEACAAF